MTTGFPTTPPAPAGLHELRKNWGWLLALGVALVVLGSLAIVASFIATLATVIVFGILLLLGGGAHLANAFWARSWRGFFLHLLLAVLYVVLGFLMVARPVASAAALTLMLAAVFLVGGLFRVIAALVDRFPGWGWVLLNGAVTVLLGFLIWSEWPESSFWVIGLFVGIDLLLSGWTWVMLALGVKNLPAARAE